MNLSNYQIVVLECPYNTIAESSETQSLFSSFLGLKLKGYLKEYPHGVMPVGAYDFIGNLIFLCEKKDGQLHPVMCFKSVTADICEYFGVPFEAFVLFRGNENPKHQMAMNSIVASCKRQGKKVGYNSSWTIHPSWRESAELKKLARDLTAALICSYYTTYRIAEVLIGGAMRFKVEKFQAFMGFENIKYDGQDLPPVNCPFAFGEKTQIMHLTKFTKETMELANLFSTLWNDRLTIADASKFEERIASKAA